MGDKHYSQSVLDLKPISVQCPAEQVSLLQPSFILLKDVPLLASIVDPPPAQNILDRG